MSRYGSQTSYRHRCRYMSPFVGFSGYYEISWSVDRYYESSRLRHPTGFSRRTDEKGARRFCKKHGIDFPEKLQ